MLIVDRVVGWFAPHICISCGREGSVLCPDCLLSAGSPPPPRCAGCKALSVGYKTCTSCRSWLDIYAVFVATEYSGMYEQLVRAYKFDLRRQAAVSIAHIMISLPGLRFPAGSLLIPLPTASARVRMRGFDHAKLLAQSWHKRMQESAQKNITLSNALRRRSNIRQLGSSREQRVKQVRNEFYITNAKRIRGKSCIVIDDVTTTGASLAAAAKTLKDAGAARVYAIVFAQKM